MPTLGGKGSTHPGEVYDRYGTVKGEYFSPMGTPADMRALPSSVNVSQENMITFEVLKSFPVKTSTVAPAFGKIGLGTQYKAPVSIEYLQQFGYIKIR